MTELYELEISIYLNEYIYYMYIYNFFHNLLNKNYKKIIYCNLKTLIFRMLDLINNINVKISLNTKKYKI